MPITISPSQQRLGLRLVLGFAGLLVLRSLFFPSSSRSSADGNKNIQSHGVLERVLLTEKYLDVHKYPFLQHRQGRDDRWDLFDDQVKDGLDDFWQRFQKPFVTGKDTAHLDQQVVRGAIDDLFSFNGWVTQGCSTLKRPFGQNSIDEHYEDLAGQGKLYYIAIIIHSADHFLVDQLAVIVQLAKRLGPQNIFVSMLDSASDDSTPTLADLSEAVLITLGIAFRIRRVPPMTVDPSAAYYPLEEATARNAALEPLHELFSKRNVKFHKVIWLKGFTCPNDILESLRVSEVNRAAMVCGMDWAEHNGFFIFSDRYVAFLLWSSLPLIILADGERGISKATCSDKQNQTPSPKLVRQETRPERNDTPNICPSRHSAANPEPTSSTRNNPTTVESTTEPRTSRKTCHRTRPRSNGIPSRSAWIRRRCGSVGICGRMRHAAG